MSIHLKSQKTKKQTKKSVPRSVKNKPELILEIGTEEMPSNLIADTLAQLSQVAGNVLSTRGLHFDSPSVQGLPQRLILHVPQIGANQEDHVEMLIGPPQKIGFDAEGRPTVAAIKFAEGAGVPLSDIQIVQKEKGAYLAIEKKIKGERTAALLKTILPEIIATLIFPRSMHWNTSRVSFVRPIRWIMAIYNGKPIRFSYAGVASDSLSYGRRLLDPIPFRVSDFESYRKELKKRFILIDPKERRQRIVSAIAQVAKEYGSEVQDNPELVEQAVFMVDFPKIVTGTFDPTFLQIPAEVIISVLKEHQGYFSLCSKQRRLLPRFISVINGKTAHVETVRHGMERVVQARLSDAEFYYKEDRTQRLFDRVEMLKGATFQEKLGTLYEKTERLVQLSKWMAGQLKLDSNVVSNVVSRAALLCKADILTGLVREFPSLQGTMGRVYALLDGEESEVATAIEEHYLPTFSGGALPLSRPGQILAVVDKIDTLVGCFGVGLIPTGSEDPYALRRQGLGVIQILAREKRHFSLNDLIGEAIRLYGDQGKFREEEIRKEVIRFLKQRLSTYLQSEGIRPDLIQSVLSSDMNCLSIPIESARVLSRLSASPLFGQLVTVVKRVSRILPKEFQGRVAVTMLTDPAEQDLYAAVMTAQRLFDEHFTALNFEPILKGYTLLADPLNRFFEEVRVIAPDEAIRNNRLGLLYAARQLFDPFGDFSKVVEAGTSESKPPNEGHKN